MLMPIQHYFLESGPVFANEEIQHIYRYLLLLAGD